MISFGKIHQDIEDLIGKIPCKPANVIYPNQQGATAALPRWQVQFLGSTGGRQFSTGESFQRMLMQIDVVVESASQTDKMDEYISALYNAFRRGTIIGDAEVVRHPDMANLGYADGGYRAVLTIPFEFAIVPLQTP